VLLLVLLVLLVLVVLLAASFVALTEVAVAARAGSGMAASALLMFTSM